MTTNGCSCACCAPTDVEDVGRSREELDPANVQVLQVDDRLAELEERLSKLEQRAG